jgi:hypothetical protein
MIPWNMKLLAGSAGVAGSLVVGTFAWQEASGADTTPPATTVEPTEVGATTTATILVPVSPTPEQLAVAVEAYCAARDECRGVPGLPGEDGQDGVDGRDGVDGAVGPPGSSVVGPAGRDGEDGTSVVGPPGRDGEDGATVVGPPGRDGEPGASGADGATVVGPPGRDGAAGPQGAPGATGGVGAPGADSQVPGPAGPQGEPGPPATGLVCPDGFEPGDLTLNAPGGQVTMYVCLAP